MASDTNLGSERGACGKPKQENPSAPKPAPLLGGLRSALGSKPQKAPRGNLSKGSTRVPGSESSRAPRDQLASEPKKGPTREPGNGSEWSNPRREIKTASCPKRRSPREGAASASSANSSHGHPLPDNVWAHDLWNAFPDTLPHHGPILAARLCTYHHYKGQTLSFVTPAAYALNIQVMMNLGTNKIYWCLKVY